jgi:hypothetical protein
MNRIITSPTSKSSPPFCANPLIPSATFANADHGTSNITATDSSGLMCSVTTTVGLPWGSGIMVPKWGLVLNDSMDDFSIEGRPNGFGYEPSPTNLGKSIGAIYEFSSSSSERAKTTFELELPIYRREGWQADSDRWSGGW